MPPSAREFVGVLFAVGLLITVAVIRMLLRMWRWILFAAIAGGVASHLLFNGAMALHGLPR